MQPVRLELNEEHPFWVAYLGDDIYEAAGVRRSDLRCIEVLVDEATGNPGMIPSGYPGSALSDMEVALHDKASASIVQALIVKMKAGELTDSGYEAFRDRHSGMTSANG